MNIQQLISHYQTFHKNIVHLYAQEKKFYKDTDNKKLFNELKQNFMLKFGKYEKYIDKRKIKLQKLKQELSLKEAQKSASEGDIEFFYSIVDDLKEYFEINDYMKFYSQNIRPKEISSEILSQLQTLAGFSTQIDYMIMKQSGK